MRSTSGYASISCIFFHHLQPRDSMAPITRGLPNAGHRCVYCVLPIHVGVSGAVTGLRLNKANTFHRCINPFPNKPWFLYVCSTSLFENTVGKGEIARHEQFLLFLQCFLPFWRMFCHFLSNLKLSSANSSSLEKSKICRLGKS